VADAYHKGEGVERNLQLATKYYQAAAEKGLRIGQFNLGVALLRDAGGAPDLQKKAITFFKKAGDTGLPQAQYAVGLNCLIGRGVDRMDEVGLKWIELGAKQGFGVAQTCLGLIYLSGHGRIRSNRDDAFDWFQKASTGGNLIATIYTGFCFLRGLGTGPNFVRAKGIIAGARKEAEERAARGEAQGDDSVVLSEAFEMIEKMEKLLAESPSESLEESSI